MMAMVVNGIIWEDQEIQRVIESREMQAQCKGGDKVPLRTTQVQLLVMFLALAIAFEMKM